MCVCSCWWYTFTRIHARRTNCRHSSTPGILCGKHTMSCHAMSCRTNYNAHVVRRLLRRWSLIVVCDAHVWKWMMIMVAFRACKFMFTINVVPRAAAIIYLHAHCTCMCNIVHVIYGATLVHSHSLVITRPHYSLNLAYKNAIASEDPCSGVDAIWYFVSNRRAESIVIQSVQMFPFTWGRSRCYTQIQSSRIPMLILGFA